MKLSLTLLIAMMIYLEGSSATIPSAENISNPRIHLNEPVKTFPDISKLTIKNVEKLLGRKMKLKEKIAFKVYQWKLKQNFITKDKAHPNRGKTAMILGIIAIGSLFIPYVNIISIPCTVLALVFGYQAKRADPEDRQARTAITLGWITVGLYVLALIIAVLFVLAFTFE
jgi:hypothetical protein